jgi:hypothetical protein
VGVEELVANLADHRQLRGVNQVVVELNYLLEADADRLEGSLEVLEHLVCLGTDVTRPNQCARGVEGDLPGDVDGPPSLLSDPLLTIRATAHLQ